MRLHGHDIAVCSWSLRPQGMADLVPMVKDLGLGHVQLALADLAQLDDKRKHQELGHLRDSGLKFTGGMVHFHGEDYSTIERIRQTGGFIPEGEWPLRKKITVEVAKLARELGMGHVMAHVGFVPPHGHRAYPHALDRVREVARIFSDYGLALHMETGQEPARELLQFLNDLAAANVHINFDPANMILYGAGDPIEAIRVLGPHIRHVHAKDATGSDQPGKEWGAEVPFGTGQVNVGAFLKALKDVGYVGPLALEREAGENRVGDVRTGIESIRASKVG